MNLFESIKGNSLKEYDNKKCVLCGKHFTEWGNDPWPLAEEGYCCDACNRDKVIPARLAMSYTKKSDVKNEAEYNGTPIVYELPTSCENTGTQKYSIGEKVYFYHGGTDFSDPARIIGYYIDPEQNMSYYAIKFTDGDIGIGQDPSLYDEESRMDLLDDLENILGEQ